MTVLKSEVVSRRVLAQIGARLGLMDAIRVDPANLRTFNERSRESLRADVLEALVGAIHLDQGRDAAAAFVAREILPAIPLVHATLGERNPKGALQERMLRATGILPHYRRDHDGRPGQRSRLHSWGLRGRAARRDRKGVEHQGGGPRGGPPGARDGVGEPGRARWLAPACWASVAAMTPPTCRGTQH